VGEVATDILLDCLVEARPTVRPPLPLNALAALRQRETLRTVWPTVDATSTPPSPTSSTESLLELNLCDSWISDHVVVAAWLKEMYRSADVAWHDWEDDPDRPQLWKNTKVLLAYMQSLQPEEKQRCLEEENRKSLAQVDELQLPNSHLFLPFTNFDTYVAPL
jgi:hypothetical protein